MSTARSKWTIWVVVLAGMVIAVAVWTLRDSSAARAVQDLFMMRSLPHIGVNTSLGMIFVVGILTSFHCIGMCGGIAISQSNRRGSTHYQSAFHRRFESYLPSARYNGGRIVAYTIVGGIAGGIGQAIQLTGVWRGLLPLLAGLFMVIMGINLLGIWKVLRRFNLRMPYFAANVISRGASRLGPFSVGMLSGLMPCGPLQIIQLYALSTGSVFYGGLSALLFSLGTAPMLFVFGSLNTVLSKKFTSRMIKVSAAIVIVLGLVMVDRGMALAGVTFRHHSILADGDESGVASLSADGSVQHAVTLVRSDSYSPIVVQRGIPVNWSLLVEEEDLNRCNDTVIVPSLRIEAKLAAGTNLIQFTPVEEGTIVFTCWMGMIKSVIVVVEELSQYNPDESIHDTADEPHNQEGSTAIGSPVETPAVATATPTAAPTAPTATPAVAIATPTATPAVAAPTATPTATPTEAPAATAPIAGEPEAGEQHLEHNQTGIAVYSPQEQLQIVTTTVGANSYSPITVQVGVSVRWIISVEAEELNECNNEILAPDFDISKKLVPGDNIVEFTPSVPGEFPFTCWMEMLKSTITVVEDLYEPEG